MRSLVNALIALSLASAPVRVLAQDAQTFRYDANGRLIAVTTAKPNAGVYSSYALDDADNRTARNSVATGYPAVPYRLASGEQLVPAQQLTSQDGRFALKVQQDGNLVLWFGSTQLWSTGTATGQSLYFGLQTNGTATLYNVAQASLWSSPSAGTNATLTVQNDGDLVLRNSGGTLVWHSNTCCH